MLPFKSIYAYLNGILYAKEVLPEKAIIILCAAVSDFIPETMAEHKIQTTDVLDYRLVNAPKILGKMSGEKHLCVSFKLETDKEIL